MKVDDLSGSEIKKYIDGEFDGLTVEVYESMPSTNSFLRQKALDGSCAQGYTVIAKEQTGGRGRFKRSFFSPGETGLYMSILLCPEKAGEAALNITTTAAVAVCEAIESFSDKKPGIKWVNDIFLDSRKVCGILAEGFFSSEGKFFVVLGIGVNLFSPEGGFPEEIEKIAGCVFEDFDSALKAKFTAWIINSFLRRYNNPDKSDTVSEYIKRSILVGKKVTVIKGDGRKSATVQSIDEKCRLIVRYENSEQEALGSGEVSLALE